MAEAMAPNRPLALFAQHPKGLRLLFFTELWERFSFYGMRALLILYLTKSLSFADDQAYGVYGAYTALVYVGPLLGGLLADRLLGARHAVTFGAILIAMGHFTLALSGGALGLFYLALAFLIVGEAFFKANISTLVGRLYGEGDKRRDGGFTLFYMGINAGAFAALTLCPILQARWGWAYGFGAAGIGMLIGLVIFLRGLPGLGGLGDPPDAARLRRPLLGPLNLQNALYLAGIAGVGLAALLVQNTGAVGMILSLGGGTAALGLVAYALTKLEPKRRDRLLVALALSAFGIVFIVLFEQAGSSLNLFADRNVDRNFLGVPLETAHYQSFNPLFILLMAPFFSALWPALDRRGKAVSTPAKFAVGLALMGAGFAVLVIAGAYSGRAAEVASIWLVLTYLLHTMGELCIQPIGLSMITKLSPREIVGFSMGVWFLCTAAGQYLAAQLAKIASLPKAADGRFDPLQSLHGYVNLFGILALLAFVVALFLVALRGPLQRRMHGVD